MIAATYHLSGWRRLLNSVVRILLHVGLAPRHTYLLTVRGRRSGTPYSTPVTLVEKGTNRWLVAPYGEVSWVRNARAAGQVTLSRGRRSEPVTLGELGPEEAAPVLRQYVTEVPITRPFFDVTPDSSLEAFVAEAHRHPVSGISGRCPRPTLEHVHPPLASRSRCTLNNHAPQPNIPDKAIAVHATRVCVHGQSG